jgi:ketosteroid isomerase-like protein
MNIPSILVALSAIALGAGACHKATDTAAPPPVSEADATRIADATVAGWTSMDVTKIKALYGPSVVGFDYAIGPLSTDRVTWDRAQDIFAAAKIDGANQISRNIQILDSDVFVVSGVWDVKSSSTPASNGTVRCTDVYQKDSNGHWPIVNEHCSAMPKPVA